MSRVSPHLSLVDSFEGSAQDIVTEGFLSAFQLHLASQSNTPLLCLGDARLVLSSLPDRCVDFVMTSPPYWGLREYDGGGLGLESDHHSYIRSLLAVFAEVKRVLKDSGSFWLNLGDTYHDKRLLGIPWRVAIQMTDTQGWTLRNSVIWNKVKGGMDTSKDRLANLHENLFHFVKDPKNYYYNMDAIRSQPGKTKVLNGGVVSATGVSGVKYKRQIERSTELSDDEKGLAIAELNGILTEMVHGRISDFRMIIRGVQRTTHSNSERVSGRAKELREKGFYFLKYNPKGSKPGDVWDIIPEDTQGRELHFAPYPLELCTRPLKATCPSGGIVLDPFCGTGTTLLAAKNYGLHSVGVDTSLRYLQFAQERCGGLL